MRSKLSDLFHDNLIAQYKEMIHEALLESDHLMFLDEDLFNQKLKGIMAAAKVDGLKPEDIMILTEEAKKEIVTHRKAG
jgi:hypothetical protein